MVPWTLFAINEFGGIRYLAQLPPSTILSQLGFQPPIVHANMQAQELPYYTIFPFLSHDKSCTFEMKVPLSISSRYLMMLNGKKEIFHPLKKNYALFLPK
jgi:hypothetical protein